MRRKIFRKFTIITLFTMMFILLSYVQTASILPGRITLIEGEEYLYSFRLPLKLTITADKLSSITVNDNRLDVSRGITGLTSSFHITSKEKGIVNLRLKLFGLFPVKTMLINTVPSVQVIPCGNTVGVKISTRGILVIAVSDVEGVDGRKVEPARQAGIVQGDIITIINGEKLKDIDRLVEKVQESKGNVLNVTYERDGRAFNTNIKPVKAVEDSQYHMGLWVRDSTAGIGTMTFFDPKTGYYGALGHGIADIDTGSLLRVGAGEILQSNILSVRRAEKGKPGELKGVFMEDRKKLGTIIDNCDYGIYGKLNETSLNYMAMKPMPIALSTQVKAGPAKILSNIQGNKVEEFDIEIQKVARQNINNSKGMVIKITDKRLMDATGGIVQGMSGSPIIQEGKIVGAVTHVLINRPECGYGVFIEWMINHENQLQEQNMNNAGIG